MRRLRRDAEEVRVELTPMIDVVFLLLTFFVFSIVMMVRADVLNVDLPELASGVPAERVEPIVVSVGDDGGLTVGGEVTAMGDVVDTVRSMQEERAGAPIVLAVDVGSPSGVLIELADRLTGGGLGSFSILGRSVVGDGEGLGDLPEDGGGD